jgi:hypothetical protein
MMTPELPGYSPPLSSSPPRPKPRTCDGWGCRRAPHCHATRETSQPRDVQPAHRRATSPMKVATGGGRFGSRSSSAGAHGGGGSDIEAHAPGSLKNGGQGWSTFIRRPTISSQCRKQAGAGGGDRIYSGDSSSSASIDVGTPELPTCSPPPSPPT